MTLLPNRRRLDARVADVFRQQPETGVIPAPPLAVFSQWVEKTCVRICMLEGEAVPASVSPVELQLLWAGALGREMDFLAEGERNLAARQARAAHRQICHWWPDGEPPQLAAGFRKAGRDVSNELARGQALSPEGWLRKFGERLRDAHPLPLKLPQRLLLDGFIEITALEQWVLDGLEARGVAIEPCEVRAFASTECNVFRFPSETDELSAVALWAKERVESGCGQVAVVVQKLSRRLSQVRTAFENVFHGERIIRNAGQGSGDFHLTQGEPISEQPTIQDALLLLSLSTGGLNRQAEFHELSRWLLSPYWRGADSERVSRGELEIHLRRLGRFWQSPAAVLRLADQPGYGARLEQLASALQLVRAVLAKGLPEDGYARQFYNLLEAWGWPGPLANREDAGLLVGKLVGLLEQLARLEPRSGQEALAQLRQLCAESRPVLHGGPLSKVQIISPEDAVNNRFDAAWVANVHDGNWPGQPLQNPFLPPAAHNRIPRCTSDGELAYTRLLTEQLKAIAPQVHFSYSRQTADVPNSISPLLGGLEVTEVEKTPSTALFRLLAPELSGLSGYRSHPWLREKEDRQGLPLISSLSDCGPGRKGESDEAEPYPIPGGSAMFHDQSDCPMLAYMRHRLGARFDDAPTPFADAAYRGSLMHTAMQHLFAQHSGTDSLPDASEIAAAVETALRYRRAAERLLPASFEAERERLNRVLLEWLQFESARTGYRVEAVEKEVTARLRSHSLSLRIDRIDRLETGELMIIDYKSSAATTSGWAKDRLRQAQLPLYAVLLGQSAGSPIGGAALAVVRGGECGFDGITKDASNAFEGIKDFTGRRTLLGRSFEGWDELMRHWRNCIEGLAVEIEQGDCPNVVFNKDNFALAGLGMLLRHPEAEAWLTECGKLRTGNSHE